MEELWKEMEAPPPPPSTKTSTSTASSWANDLAGLSTAQTNPTFSVGGAPFSTAQSFGAPQNQFGAPSQPFGQPGFGGQPAGSFGVGGQPGFGGGFPQSQPQGAGFGAPPNPFGVRDVLILPYRMTFFHFRCDSLIVI